MTIFANHRFAAALVPALLFLGADARAQPCPLAGQNSMLIVQMFFGQNIEGRRDISPAAWRGFLSHDVTQRFPDGFTVFDAIGQWRDPKTRAVGREHTKVLEIATSDTPDVRSKIEDIAARYRTLFHQQSVGIVTMPGCARF
jgi:Protein of unknown function (DUF3574)